MFLGHDISFWIAVAIATFIKVATSARKSFFVGFVMVISAIFLAWVFTKPTLDWLSLNQETYTIPVAVLIAFTGEAILRFSLSLIEDSQRVVDIIKAWRGH